MKHTLAEQVRYLAHGAGYFWLTSRNEIVERALHATSTLSTTAVDGLGSSTSAVDPAGRSSGSDTSIRPTA